MKKLIGLTGCVVIFCLLINSVLLPSLPTVKAEGGVESSDTAPRAEPPSEAEPSTSSVADKEVYLLKSYKGRVAVFLSGLETPIRVTDTDVTKLPEEDRKSLESGIEARDKLELERLLEDFCS